MYQVKKARSLPFFAVRSMSGFHLIVVDVDDGSCEPRWNSWKLNLFEKEILTIKLGKNKRNLSEHVILEERIVAERKLDSVAGFDVVELLHLNLKIRTIKIEII